MKSFFRFTPFFSVAFGVAILLANAQAQIIPQGDGLNPKDRERIFWETIEKTLQQMPGAKQKDLLMVGTGSWMSTEDEARKRSNDIDATIAYLEGHASAAQTFQEKFYENLKKTGLNPQPDITLFVDEMDEGKQDFYRGPTGNYFFYKHSKHNNPRSSFDLALDDSGRLPRPDGRPESKEVEDFWVRRGKDIPTKIAQAHLFVEDNQIFLDNKFKHESDLVKSALAIAKYVDRVEEMLKEEIEKQWGKELPVPPYLEGMVEKISCMRRYFYILEFDLQPRPEEKQRIMDCLGAKSDADFKRRIAEFYEEAQQYFKVTRSQVIEAEEDIHTIFSDDDVPSDIVQHTGEVKVFRVRPGQWLSTGIQLKQGQYFQISATGTVKREGDREWGPNGYYHLGFMAFTLKAMVGEQLFDIGTSGGGQAPVDGELRLGITYTYTKVDPAEARLQGAFNATVTITGTY